MTQQGGSVPRWPLAHGYTGCMIGNHAGQVVATPLNKSGQLASCFQSFPTRYSPVAHEFIESMQLHSKWYNQLHSINLI